MQECGEQQRAGQDFGLISGGAGLLWTHFSGHESVTESVVRGIISFALLAGAVLAAVLVRIG